MKKHSFSWKWWFKSLNNFFRRPKFSPGALEPAEPLLKKDEMWGLAMNNIMREQITIVPSGRIDYCSTCKKDHGYDCPME